MEAEENREIAFAEFTLDPRRRQLLCGKTVVPLNPRALDLLYFLTRNAGRIVSKEEIFDSVWKDQFVEESNLAVQISAIRRALGDRAADARFLATIPGKGYQFTAPVSFSEKGNSQILAADVRSDPNVIAVLPKRSINTNRWLTVFGSAAILLAVLFGLVRYFTRVRDSSVRSIAVIPFVEQATDASEDVVGDGLAESVIFSLSRVPGIKVMSRNSAFRYRGEINAKEIGRDLHVDGVLTGRILRSDDSISIRAELISTEDNSLIWSDQLSRKIADMQMLPIDITQAISRSLKIKLPVGQASTGKSQTENFEAYHLYLLGRYHLSRLTDDGFLKGRDTFRQATEKDPNYALAHAGLADAYNMLCGWGAMAPNDGYPLAKAAAIRALELDETLSEAHSSLGVVKLFYDADWSGAEKELSRAIELNPNNSEAQMMYGHELMLLGRFAEARPYMERAIDLDPLSLVKIISVGNVSYFERDFSRALEMYRQALERDTNSGLAHWSVGNALLASDNSSEAIKEFQTAITLSGDSPDEPASLGLAYALTGNEAGAKQVVGNLMARSQRSYVPPSLAAAIYGALGKHDEAFALLEQAFRERDALLVYLKVDPMFDSLRSDARFPQLLGRMGFK